MLKNINIGLRILPLVLLPVLASFPVLTAFRNDAIHSGIQPIRSFSKSLPSHPNAVTRNTIRETPDSAGLVPRFTKTKASSLLVSSLCLPSTPKSLSPKGFLVLRI